MQAPRSHVALPCKTDADTCFSLLLPLLGKLWNVRGHEEASPSKVCGESLCCVSLPKGLPRQVLSCSTLPSILVPLSHELLGRSALQMSVGSLCGCATKKVDRINGTIGRHCVGITARTISNDPTYNGTSAC